MRKTAKINAKTEHEKEKKHARKTGIGGLKWKEYT